MSQTAVLYAFDLCGTFLFALGGGMLAVERRLDIFGVLVLAYASAVAGGILRDIFLGISPPGAIADWRYLAITAFAGLIAFAMPRAMRRLSGTLVVLDALGLAFFAVNGALKAMAAGLDPVMAAVLGTITAAGGGVVRDIMTARVPMVLHADIYAVAALAAAAVAAFGHSWGTPFWPTVLFAGVLCISLRLTAYFEGWHLPRANPDKSKDAAADNDREHAE